MPKASIQRQQKLHECSQQQSLVLGSNSKQYRRSQEETVLHQRERFFVLKGERDMGRTGRAKRLVLKHSEATQSS